MMRKRIRRPVLLGCIVLGLSVAGLAWFGDRLRRGSESGTVEVIEVRPGEDIQAALEAGARRPVKPVIRVHAGVYRPSAPNEAFLYFNSRHDGIVLEGVGEVTLTAANPDLADPRAESYPAIVNRVLYFGDGISSRTVLRNFKISGANGFVQGPQDLPPVNTADDLLRSARYQSHESRIEANHDLPKTHYFYTDGGAILVYGRSYPVIENVTFLGNRSLLCGGAVSIQHHGSPFGGTVRFRNCIFQDNHAGTSGGAIDVLTEGSCVSIANCLFVGNVSDERVILPQNPRFGALSIFPGCRATDWNCTFTDNCSGADDRGQSTYQYSIYWNNQRPGGISRKPAFEVNVANAAGVEGCIIGGREGEPCANVSPQVNRFDAPDPEFDSAYRPRNPQYEGVGYRPGAGRP
jgi:hypothetical protein